MKRWPTKPLLKVATIVSSRAGTFEGKRHYVATGGLDGGTVVAWEEVDFASKPSRADLVAKQDDVLFARMQATNKVALVTEKSQNYIWSTGFAALRPNVNLRSRFLMHYLASPCFQAAKDVHCTGATQKSLSNDGLGKLTIPVPPLAEQEQIVKLLDEADELRKLRVQANRRTAALIPALFHAMFGDPALNVQAMQVVRLGDLCEITPNYGTMIPARAGEGKWLTLRVGNIQDGLLDLTDQKFVDLPDDTLERHAVKDGDLLLARAIGSRDHLGKCVVVSPGKQMWAFDSHLMRVRLNRQRCEPDWLKTLLDTPGGRMLFLNNTRQSAVQFNINSKEFVAIAVPIPPLPLQKEFAQRVTEIRELEAGQAASRRRLDELFHSLLHRAFEGEL